ncbi:MAG TPA: DUF4864 domain-containing protein [Candidatus Limnocylindrales bacterium]|nr:DUF4864 domain-containing protein [Candidatus Limnocylindrales bacterium]
MLQRLPALAFEPDAALPPEDVVKIQLDLLQNDDLLPYNAGLRAAYAFASPASRSTSGPFERFIALLETPGYAPLIGFTQAQLDQMIASKRKAYQRAHVLQRSGEWVTYLFILSRQQEPPYIGCWMTDAVIRVSEAG